MVPLAGRSGSSYLRVSVVMEYLLGGDILNVLEASEKGRLRTLHFHRRNGIAVGVLCAVMTGTLAAPGKAQVPSGVPI